MKIFFILVAFLLSITTLSSQNQQLLVGKWKITALNAGLQHDYKTNKTTLTKELEALQKSDKDADKFALAFSMGLIDMFKDFEYAFGVNGQYSESFQSKDPKLGFYIYDETQKTLVLTSKNKLNADVTQQMNFDIKENVLILTIPKGEQTIGFTFEKYDW
jgi:hypothetical protein